MDLVSTPKNPIPLGASAGYLDIRKGVRIRYASWQSALRQRRGTVCIFPGRNEFIEKYFEVVGELRRRGPAGQQLISNGGCRDGQTAFIASLPIPEFEFGVIAGSRPDEAVVPPLE